MRPLMRIVATGRAIDDGRPVIALDCGHWHNADELDVQGDTDAPARWVACPDDGCDTLKVIPAPAAPTCNGCGGEFPPHEHWCGACTVDAPVVRVFLDKLPRSVRAVVRRVITDWAARVDPRGQWTSGWFAARFK